MAVSAIKKQKIKDARDVYDRRIVDIEDETIWELANKLNLSEATIRKIWDDAL